MSLQADPREDIQDSLAGASNYNRWIADQARAHLAGCKRVIDAGCGAGNLAELMLADSEVVGVEVWKPFVGLLEQRFAQTEGFQVVEADLAAPELGAALAERAPDGAYCSNVLEHVEDHRQALLNLANGLPSGAPFFLLVPAFPVLYGEHDRADHHFRRYTKKSFRQTVDGLPWTIERQYYMNLPGFFAWFILGRVLRRSLGEGEIGFYDRWVIPAVRAVEQRRRPPFGQSLVVLMRRA